MEQKKVMIIHHFVPVLPVDPGVFLDRALSRSIPEYAPEYLLTRLHEKMVYNYFMG